MKISDIRPKHLVLGEEYDDFAKATDRVDFSKEDLACQVTGLTSVYYWINTESVWGPLGFVWDEYNNYGHFSKSTIDFSIIPKIPDSQRHLRLYYIFKNISKQELIFLDSGWSHINEFEFFGNGGILYDWYCNSISNLENVINKSSTLQRFKLHASLPNSTFYYNTSIYLLPENKKTLKFNNRKSQQYNIYDEFLEKGDTFDTRDYIVCDKILTSYYTGNLNLLIADSYKNLIIELNTTHFGFLIYAAKYNTSYKEYKDKITFILRGDLLEEPIKIQNNNTCFTKSVEYVGIDNPMFTGIDYYYNCLVFEDGTPQVTQQMLDFTTSSIFTNCYFLKPYAYGKIKAINRVFSYRNTYAPYSKISNFYSPWLLPVTSGGVLKDGKVQLHDDDRYPLYSCDVFDFEYTEEDKEKGYQLAFPTMMESPSTNFFFIDSKLPNLVINNKIYIAYNEILVTTTKGNIRYDNISSVNKIFIADNDYKITFDTNSIVRLGWNYDSNSVDVSGLIVFEGSKARANKFIFEITKDNITDVKKEFNNVHLWNVCKEDGVTIPYIVRNNNSQFRYKDETKKGEEYKYIIQRKHYPNLDTEPLIYNVNVEITINNEFKLPNDLVQHVLDNIITIGDENDSKNRTIKILSEYYQNMKEETKERLIGDGYTIIEVI